jgi:hypothetical protein
VAFAGLLGLESLPTLPKNIAKNFVKYFHEKGRALVDLEQERMKD